MQSDSDAERSDNDFEVMEILGQIEAQPMNNQLNNRSPEIDETENSNRIDEHGPDKMVSKELKLNSSDFYFAAYHKQILHLPRIM